MMRRCLLLLLLALAVPADAAAQWIRVESPNFVVFGEIGEKRTREYAAEFERFREALGRVVSGASVRPAAPAVVFLFKDDRSFAPYRPVYNGKPVNVSGYFAGGQSLDVIMLQAGNREGALHTIYHEYSHLITVNVAPGLPAWLGEGLAEYYSAFEVQAQGRRAVMGGILPAHLIRLNQETLLPLKELLAVQYDSPLYNEGSRRSTFYAQSWALVHMLLNGQPNRSKEFNEYVRLTTAGRTAVDAWQEVFGDQKIFEELRRYVRQAQMKAYLFQFDQEIPTTTFNVSMPPPADAHAALGDLRLHVAPESAATHMDASNAPPGAFTAAIQGLIMLESGNHKDALGLLLQAATESTDWLVQYRAASGLERIATAMDGEISRTAGAAADAALRRVLDRKPDLPHAVALRALIAGPSDEGVRLMKRAGELAPGRPHYAIWRAQFHATRGEFTEARQILAPLMSPRFPKETRDYARTVMAEAVTQQQLRERAAVHTSTEPPREMPPARGIVVPLFRELQPGEQRVEATFERIECPRYGLIVHVRVGERSARYTAPDFDAVEFLTYRHHSGGPVQCGPRSSNERIYLTFRPSQDPGTLDGIVVAVEFLPR